MEMDNAQNIRKHKIKFPEISSRSWEHPADRAALTTLRKVPGLDLLLQKLIGATTERSIRLVSLASAVRVTERQFGKVSLLFDEACGILDVKQKPELFVSQSPFLNAGAIGVERPFIVLNSSLLDSLNEEELLAVMAHELGHCLSGHVLYKTLLALLIRFSVFASNIPLGNASIITIIAALREWDRKSELSADRAEILVVQDPNVSYALLMKMAGGRHIEQMDYNEFFLQAAEYEKGGTILDGVFKLLNLIGQTHPFPVIRLTELKGWVDSGAYGKILAGEYVRRDQEKNASARDDIRDAADQYKEDINNSQDPLAETLRNAATNMGETAGEMGKKAKEVFDSIFGNGGKK